MSVSLEYYWVDQRSAVVESRETYRAFSCHPIVDVYDPPPCSPFLLEAQGFVLQGWIDRRGANV